MAKVIFDSSFLMAVADRPTPWLDDISERLGKIEPFALDCVSAELRKISMGEGKKAMRARVALKLMRGFSRARCGGGKTDEEIVSAAISKRAAVATVDRELSTTLRACHVQVIELHSGRVAFR